MAPEISVIIPTYLNSNKKYLDLCLHALQSQQGISFETIIVSSCKEKPIVPDWTRLVHFDRRVHFPEGINIGADISDKRSKYILLLNDDAVPSRLSLVNMARACGDNKAIIGPMSNCDLGWRYFTDFNIHNEVKGKLTIDRFMTMEQIEGWEEDIINYHPTSHIMFPVDYVCFYATLIPRTVWDLVGPLDANYLTGHDDEDYCKMASRKGIQSYISTSAFVWHFGGRTANTEITQEIREQNLGYFTNKWKDRIL